jgi:hypothetical protein
VTPSQNVRPSSKPASGRSRNAVIQNMPRG